jgi:hypothetical protein
MGIIYDFTPDPIFLLESNRNLGYSIEEAIADLIDNSISAGARDISYELHWNNGNPFFLLKDNGKGMSHSDNEFVNSFRLGADPNKERSLKDLGRFGFGMKTASLSQARVLTVITRKKSYSIQALTLDMKKIADEGKWVLESKDENKLYSEFEYLNNIESGTIVRWDNWDRAPKTEGHFVDLGHQIRNYLSVVFHRFIENGITISNSEFNIEAVSPIPSGEGSNLLSDIELTENSNARQKAYILQHPRKWAEDYDNINGFNSFRLFNGFERQQGIYIYRCDRLLTPNGGWLGLLNKGNSAKLARVVIDYPNDADTLWSLDITKTNASIPIEFRDEILNLVRTSRLSSVEKINRADRKVRSRLSNTHSHIWKTTKLVDLNSCRYEVDLNHPLFQEFVVQGKISKLDLKLLLDVISGNLPIAKIIENNDAEPLLHDRMSHNVELTPEEIEMAKLIIHDKTKFVSRMEAISWILNFEPFCYHEHQLRNELL